MNLWLKISCVITFLTNAGLFESIKSSLPHTSSFLGLARVAHFSSIWFRQPAQEWHLPFHLVFLQCSRQCLLLRCLLLFKFPECSFPLGTAVSHSVWSNLPEDAAPSAECCVSPSNSPTLLCSWSPHLVLCRTRNMLHVGTDVIRVNFRSHTGF